MRTAAVNAALEKAISRERLRKYLAYRRNNLDDALTLYEKNMRLSEAFYSPLQCLEVCLRNPINTAMTAVYGTDWLTRDTAAPLTVHSRSFIADTIRGMDDEDAITTGRIVADLRFAFWVGLLGRHYDATLWRRALYRCFLADGGRRRSDVHGRLNAIRRFRNRIAHHEPIFHRPVESMHEEIIEAIGWMCPHTRNWTLRQSRVPAVLDE